jgi:hypothetical protein
MKKLKTWCDKNEWYVFIICVALTIPLAIWFANLWFDKIDKPWAVVHHDLSAREPFIVILSLLLMLEHTLLCLWSQKNPFALFIQFFQTIKKA